jgi:integrase
MVETWGVQKVTKRIVGAATPEAERFIIWDLELKGFGLLVLPSGVKSYVYQYRTPEGRKRRITIGKHGEWTADKARKKAEDYREIVRHGGDPLGNKRALRDSATVNDVLDAYLASVEFQDKAEVTKAIDRGRIERHLRPLLGKKYAHLVTESDVKRAFNSVRDGKTAVDVKTRSRGRARVRGGAGAARMAIVLLSIVYNWAIRTKLIKAENPCRHVDIGSSGTRDAILESAADYAAMFKALERMETERRIRAPAADAIRLIALTGCRRGEAANLRWRHVERNRIVLPAREHKTGKRTGKPRIIALPTAAQAIIARQPEGQPDDYVFAPARGNGGAMELTHVWDKVRKEAKLPAGVSLHGLRHSTASHMAMSGSESAQIMAALGHRQLSTVQRYIHFAKDAHQALAETAAAVAVAGMAAASKPKGKVVKLKGGRS